MSIRIIEEIIIGGKRWIKTKIETRTQIKNVLKNKQSLLVLLICIIVMLLCMNMMTKIGRGDSSKIKYSEFITMLDKGEVESVVLKSDTLTITLKHGTGVAAQTKTTTLMEDLSDLPKGLKNRASKISTRSSRI